MPLEKQRNGLGGGGEGGKGDIEEQQMSISSLKSKFESLSAVAGQNQAGPGQKKPVSKSSTPSSSSPNLGSHATGDSVASVKTIPLYLGSAKDSSQSNNSNYKVSAPNALSSPAPTTVAAWSNGLAAPQTKTLAEDRLQAINSSHTEESAFMMATKRAAPAIPPKSSVKAQPTKPSTDNEENEAPPSVKSLRGIFDSSATAGPSRPRSTYASQGIPEPAQSSERLARPHPPAPAIKRVSTGGTITEPPSPVTITHPAPVPRRPSSSHLLDRPTVSAPISRAPSPKPPEPDRSNKPTPRASPQPSPALSRESSDQDIAKTATATITSPPRLPVRKATLPIAVPAAVAPPPLPLTRPVSSAPLSTSPAKSLDNVPTPRLPERPRSKTIGKESNPVSVSRQPTLPSGSMAPRLPVRSETLAIPPTQADVEYQPPPPPMRSAMGTNTLLTPPKRKNSNTLVELSSGEEDEDDDEGGVVPVLNSQAKRMLEDFPDSTRANKRPPTFVPDIKISSHYHIHAFAVHGRYVCNGSYQVRVYDTQMGDQPLFTVDLKETGLDFRIKEPRVTAMMFRPVAKLVDEGRYLWCGTKDGHLWELDIRTGKVSDTRAGVHGSAVVSIFRHQNYLLTLEENGKLHVFEVGKEGSSDTPVLIRTVRISDRFTFAKLICGKLWTATAPPNRSTTNTSSRGPTIRVYEPCAPGSMPPARTLYTSEWTGAVTSAAILPLQPNIVYLAHEGGFVSVWDSADFSCTQVLKISSTDILSLEGVGDRLWTGNRKGQIHVYDVSERPWQTTNIWNAHGEHAVHELQVDFRAIEDSGRFTLWSCARESMRAWDGLLSVDWIDKRMTTRQPDYCTFRELEVLVLTFNIDSAKPHDLSGSEVNLSFMNELLSSVELPDIIAVGFQEVIPLTDKKLTAKTLLFGGKKDQTMLGDKVSQAYRQWVDKLQHSIRTCIPGTPYTNVHSDNLVGLLSCIFVKSSEKDNLTGLDITTVKRGIGGIYGNKGAIVARMIVDDTSICHINVHLAAGQSQKASRNADLAGIMEDKALLPPLDSLPFVHGGDGTGILDHEIVILAGDMNYRIDQRRESVISSVSVNDLSFLLEHDQLRKEMRNNHAFRLRAFEEAPITFKPTYKYNAGSDEYDSSEKKRIPAWCDRVLYRKTPRIENTSYRRYETTISDHKPVSAGFKIQVKAVNHEKMKVVRGEVGKEWSEKEAEMLDKIMDALPAIL